MGKLTEEMTRLRGEINVLRGMRKTMLKDLGRHNKAMKSAVAKMQAGFRQGHAHMARASRAERQGFASNLARQVSRMQAGFRQAHADMTRAARSERLGFLAGLKGQVAAMQSGFRHNFRELSNREKMARRRFVTHLAGTVRGLRRELAADLAGARRAFFAFSPGELKARVEAERPRPGAERKGKEEKSPGSRANI
jgi:hypothetical protein